MIINLLNNFFFLRITLFSFYVWHGMTQHEIASAMDIDSQRLHLHCVRYHLNSILCDSQLLYTPFVDPSFHRSFVQKDIAVFVLHYDRTRVSIIYYNAPTSSRCF